MENIHFIGIGGIGMSGLAEICLERGDRVSGTDLRPNNLTRILESKGAVIRGGHQAGNVPADTDVVVRTTCIKDDNPEIKEADRRGIPVVPRGELLKRLLDECPRSIGVTGTHGKTTTTAIIARIAQACGMDPTFAIGGELLRSGGNARYGKGGVAIAEVDESDGYFKNTRVTNAVITNIEREHMESYGEFNALREAYQRFLGNLPRDGIVVYNGEDPVVRDVVDRSGKNAFSFGMSGGQYFSCRDMSWRKGIEFDLMKGGKKWGRIHSPLVGRYNLMNLLGAVGMAVLSGADRETVLSSVEKFRGVRRRFDLIGSVGDIKVIEDYAHHPTEVRSVIEAARSSSEGRVVAVFQPHRYSRTRDLLDDFTDCFYGTDILVLTDIYSADEDFSGSVSVRDIYSRMDNSCFHRVELSSKEDIPGLVAGMVERGDTVLVLGAGDIRDVSLPMLERIGRNMGQDVVRNDMDVAW